MAGRMNHDRFNRKKIHSYDDPKHDKKEARYIRALKKRAKNGWRSPQAHLHSKVKIYTAEERAEYEKEWNAKNAK